MDKVNFIDRTSLYKHTIIGSLNVLATAQQHFCDVQLWLLKLSSKYQNDLDQRYIANLEYIAKCKPAK